MSSFSRSTSASYVEGNSNNNNNISDSDDDENDDSYLDENSSSIPPMPNRQIPQPLTSSSTRAMLYATKNATPTMMYPPPIIDNVNNEEEEGDSTLSSSVIPRHCLPTPTAIPFTPNHNIKNERGVQQQQVPEVVLQNTVKKQNKSSAARAQQEIQQQQQQRHHDHHHYQNHKHQQQECATINNGNATSIFRDPPSSSCEPNPPLSSPQPQLNEFNADASFNHRIDAIASKLLELDLITPNNNSTNTSYSHSNNPSSSPTKEDSPLTHFLYTLRCMAMVVSKTPNTAPLQKSKKCRALDSLLYMFENVVKEAVHLGSVAEYWRDKVAVLKSQQEDQNQNDAMKRQVKEMQQQAKREMEKEREEMMQQISKLLKQKEGMQSKLYWYEDEVKRLQHQSHQQEEEKKMDPKDLEKKSAKITMDHATDTSDLQQSIHDENAQLKCMLQQMERKIESLGGGGGESINSKTPPPAAAATVAAVPQNKAPEQQSLASLQQQANLIKSMQQKIEELQKENESIRRQESRKVLDDTCDRVRTLAVERRDNGNDVNNNNKSILVDNMQHQQHQQQLDQQWKEEMQNREAELYQALSTREKELIQNRETLKHLQMQNNELHHLLHEKNEYIERAERDMHAMTRENQAVSGESGRLGAELNTARQRLQKETRRADSAEHDARAARLEKDDVLANYRAVVEERTQLEQSVEESSRERNRLSHELVLSQDEVRRLRGQMDDLEAEVQKRVSHGAEFERQLDQVSRQGLATQRALDAAEVENRRLREDLHAVKQSVDMTNGHIADLRRSEAKARHDAETMRGVIQAVESERDALRKILTEERERYRGMENLISSARARDAAAADQIRNLARENAEMATKLNEANARLGGDAPRVPATVFSSVDRGHGNDDVPSRVAAVNISFSPMTQTENVDATKRMVGAGVGDDSHPRLIDYLEKEST